MVTGFTGKCTKSNEYTSAAVVLVHGWSSRSLTELTVPYRVERVELLKVRLCNGTISVLVLL
uniref:Uncharacterized protein n=1 Tax=Anguilla anguilla TaxID=7936 RepID=A0A0E9VQD8_ANGAN